MPIKTLPSFTCKCLFTRIQRDGNWRGDGNAMENLWGQLEGRRRRAIRLFTLLLLSRIQRFRQFQTGQIWIWIGHLLSSLDPGSTYRGHIGWYDLTFIQCHKWGYTHTYTSSWLWELQRTGDYHLIGTVTPACSGQFFCYVVQRPRQEMPGRSAALPPTWSSNKERKRRHLWSE